MVEKRIGPQEFSGILSKDSVPFDFPSIDTKFMLNSYVAKNLPFVAPVEYLFPIDTNCAPPSKSPVLHYVPIDRLLGVILQNTSVQAVLHEAETKSRDPRALYDVYSGTKMDDFVDFNLSSSQVIHLQFYIDEFELCNPIGAIRG